MIKNSQRNHGELESAASALEKETTMTIVALTLGLTIVSTSLFVVLGWTRA